MKKEKLRILFIKYISLISNVSKFITYINVIKFNILNTSKIDLFNRMLYYLYIKKKNKPNLKVKLIINCNFLEYIPKETKDKWKSNIKLYLVNDPNNKAANK